MEYNVYFFIILLTVVGLYKLDLFADIINLKALRPQLPKEFDDVFDAERYAKSQDYTVAKTRFGIIESTVGLAILLFFWFMGGFAWLDGIVRASVSNEVVRGLVYFSVIILANMLISLPFEIYSTFVIEEEFGFNKTTPKTFIIDRIKMLGVSAIIGLPILALILWLFGKYELAWLYAFILVNLYSLFYQYIAPTVLFPIFNKFTPLEDGELKNAIHAMAKQCNFPISGVYVIDGSLRSTKSNAFFTGFGKMKRIALFDTLIANHTVPELVGVLAHEIGHFKKKHIVQGAVFGILNSLVVFYLLQLFMRNEGLFAAFGVKETSVYLSLIFFGLLFQPLNKIVSIFLTIWSRKNEFEADAYASNVTGQPGEMVTALKKLSKDNLSNLTPHPFYVFLNYSHPPVLERIQALRALRAT